MTYQKSIEHFKIIFLIISLALMLGCEGNTPGEGQPLATVNDYVITDQAFRRDLVTSTRFHENLGITLEEKRGFLDERVQKELLIQEAVKRGLDREEPFRRTIESYWEQTLITSLLKEEMARILTDIIVTREEIEKRYKAMAGK